MPAARNGACDGFTALVAVATTMIFGLVLAYAAAPASVRRAYSRAARSRPGCPSNGATIPTMRAAITAFAASVTWP